MQVSTPVIVTHCQVILFNMACLPFPSQVQKVIKFSERFKDKCISEVVRMGGIIIIWVSYEKRSSSCCVI